MKATPTSFDCLIIGAGLAGGLVALALKAESPAARILVVEKKSRGSFSKTWSCHDSDLDRAPWLRTVVTKSWNGYDVEFPNRRRTIESRYHSLLPSSLHAELERVLGSDLRFETAVRDRDDVSVTLENGERIEARCVIDSSLPLRWNSETAGFQKFVGLHVRLSKPHGLKRPVLMDARVPQLDGFRFFYVLPFAEDELLVEDTRFSETEVVDRDSYVREIEAYCAGKGWTIAEILKDEIGVLPLPFATERRAPSESVAEIGMAAGFFHVVTGYSLPDAVRVADLIASLPSPTTEDARRALSTYVSSREAQQGYLHLLNRMMFRAAEPTERYRIFERFYGLSEGLISRFYRGELTATDRVRILVGRPPVPVTRAVRCLFESGGVR